MQALWRVGAWLLAAWLPSTAWAIPIDDEIIVHGDRFARWDATRWHIRTDVNLPYLQTLRASENLEFRTHRFQVRTVIACDKEWPLRRQRYEVVCVVEDIGVQAVVADRRAPKGVDDVLTEIDDKLSGAGLRLQVSADGRVTNLDLEGLEPSNRRERRIAEDMRQLLSRVMVGFDLRIPQPEQVEARKWTERNPALMTLPNANTGTAMLMHQADHFQGNILVQSVGTGMVAGHHNNFQLEFNGVSIYDRSAGFIRERVWSLVGQPTTTAFMQTSGVEQFYMHAGRLLKLSEEVEVDVGPTRQVALPDRPREGVEALEPID